MKCIKFPEKDCDLLTCHTKRKCLWDESQHQQGENWPENYELDHPGEKPIVQPIAYYKKKHYHSSHPYANWEEEYNHDCLMLERWEKNYDLYLKSKSQPSGSEPTAGELYRKPKVVCFCGSTRFAEWFMIKRWELEKQGIITLGINILPDNYFVEGNSHGAEQEGVKDVLDELHKRKIDLSDEVFILNVGGYIGESTRNELNYAIEKGKPVKYLEPLNSEHDGWLVGDKFTTPETGDRIFTVSAVHKNDVEACDSRSRAGYTLFAKTHIAKLPPQPVQHQQDELWEELVKYLNSYNSQNISGQMYFPLLDLKSKYLLIKKEK